jgi:hypothetical protein
VAQGDVDLGWIGRWWRVSGPRRWRRWSRNPKRSVTVYLALTFPLYLVFLGLAVAEIMSWSMVAGLLCSWPLLGCWFYLCLRVDAASCDDTSR